MPLKLVSSIWNWDKGLRIGIWDWDFQAKEPRKERICRSNW